MNNLKNIFFKKSEEKYKNLFWDCYHLAINQFILDKSPQEVKDLANYVENEFEKGKKCYELWSRYADVSSKLNKIEDEARKNEKYYDPDENYTHEIYDYLDDIGRVLCEKMFYYGAVLKNKEYNPYEKTEPENEKINILKSLIKSYCETNYSSIIFSLIINLIKDSEFVNNLN